MSANPTDKDFITIDFAHYEHEHQQNLRVIIILAVVAFMLLLGRVWAVAFFRGDTPAPYLFIKFYPWIVFAVSSIGLRRSPRLFLSLIERMGKEGRAAWEEIIVILLTLICAVGALILLAQTGAHELDQNSIQGQAFHLVKYPSSLDEPDLYLINCVSAGLSCSAQNLGALPTAQSAWFEQTESPTSLNVVTCALDHGCETLTTITHQIP